MKQVFSNLTKEEREIEDAFARGEYTQVPNFQERKIELQATARYTLAKNKVPTIRLSERNLIKVKTAAARAGVPYQTFISALIQKYT